jgi:pyruvate,water dikinase
VDEDVIELAKVGKLIEKHYAKAMDIEWAIDKDMPATRRVMIVQSRPETVWSQKKAGPQVKPKVSTLQYITASLTPDKKDQ